MQRALIILGVVLIAAGLGPSTALAAPRGQNLFIAGDGFTLDQAMGEAEAQERAGAAERSSSAART